MATAEFSTLMREVLPLCPGLPQPMGINAIRNAAIEYFKDTFAWQDTIALSGVPASSFPYPLVHADGAVSKVLWVRIGKVLPPTTLAALTEFYSNTDPAALTAAQPEAYYLPSPKALQVHPAPEAGSEVSGSVRVSLTPSLTATAVDEQLLSDAYEAISAGALSRLLAMPSVPWSNPGLAGFYTSVFRAAKADALLSAMNGDLLLDVSVEFPKA